MGSDLSLDPTTPAFGFGKGHGLRNGSVSWHGHRFGQGHELRSRQGLKERLMHGLALAQGFRASMPSLKPGRKAVTVSLNTCLKPGGGLNIFFDSGRCNNNEIIFKARSWKEYIVLEARRWGSDIVLEAGKGEFWRKEGSKLWSTGHQVSLLGELLSVFSQHTPMKKYCDDSFLKAKKLLPDAPGVTEAWLFYSGEVLHQPVIHAPHLDTLCRLGLYQALIKKVAL